VVRSVHFAVGLVAAALVAFAGCSDSGPATVPVRGTLTINGQPASNLLITFSPMDTRLPTASGQVNNGDFELRCGSEGKPGAVPGKYKVVLAQTGPSLDDAMAAMKPQPGGAVPKGAPGGPTGQKPFPDKYSNPQTSDKEVEVTSGSNDIKIEIAGT